VGLAVVLQVTAPGSAQAAVAASPAVCAAMPTGVSAAALSSGVSSGSCGGLVGATVIGRGGSAVTVPAEGATGSEQLKTTGAELLTVSNDNGVVTATDEEDDTATGLALPLGSEPIATASAQPLACSEGAYNYIHNMDHWVGKLYWYYNLASQSRSGLSGTGVLGAIRQGNSNMTLDHNDCGRTVQFNAHGSYGGTTSRFANINSAAGCTSKFPDGQNAVSWGPFDNDAKHINTLAHTCWHYFSGQFTEADIYIGSNRNIRVGVPSGCISAYDLESVVTHEWGHAFGMAHENSGQWETMYPTVDSCSTYWRTLGKGDTDGMLRLYGKR
jgi:hypothetical protein